jgi:NADPH-dependent ferric siderophore reductase
MSDILTVKRREHLTPHMIRVTLTGSKIDTIDLNCHGANCKLFLPEPGQGVIEFEKAWADGPRPTVRTYTVRALRKDMREMDIDFVDHGDAGPASAWARRAETGAFLGFRGPGPVKVKSFYADRYLIIADMSAIPVAAATLEAMPDDAVGTAIFDIASIEDKQNLDMPAGIEPIWLVNTDAAKTRAAILNMVREMDFADVRVQTCIAGESTMIKELRKHLMVDQRLPKDDCYISGYWKIGLIEDEHQQMKRAEAEQVTA